jgi:hypothetical protein
MNRAYHNTYKKKKKKMCTRVKSTSLETHLFIHLLWRANCTPQIRKYIHMLGFIVIILVGSKMSEDSQHGRSPFKPMPLRTHVSLALPF